VEITFHGGAGTVTGSKSLVRIGPKRVLVDCGMFQGLKQYRLRNWSKAPFDVGSLDAVALTHAHLDHSGWLPRLVREGYSGPVYCTRGTAALCKILLLDAARLQEEYAGRANRKHYTRHNPAEPLYDVEDAERALALLEPVDMDEGVALSREIDLSFSPTGHILGAASVRLTYAERTVCFSGDVGRMHDHVMKPPRPFGGADLLVLESTYGNRLHGTQDAEDALADVVNTVIGRGGVLMIPAFAVGRTQTLLHLLAELSEQGRIPDVPVFLNSPMAIDATEVFFAHADEHRLDHAACRRMGRYARFVQSVEESKEVNARKGPMILIAGSGMAAGGRILHHLVSFGPDSKNGILLVGYQAAGTRGAALEDGVEALKIHGEYVPIRAERFRMDSLSGHADWRELVQWLRAGPRPGRILLNHGEPVASDAMRLHLEEELGWVAEVAEDRMTVEV
jgi:metallo-beta-lactamase family protein